MLLFFILVKNDIQDEDHDKSGLSRITNKSGVKSNRKNEKSMLRMTSYGDKSSHIITSVGDITNVKDVTIIKHYEKEEYTKFNKKDCKRKLIDEINDIYNYISKLNVLLYNTKDSIFNIPKKIQNDISKMNKKMIKEEKKKEDNRMSELNKMKFFIENTFDNKIEELYSINYSNNYLNVLKNSFSVEIRNTNEILTNLINFKIK